uniref:Mitochondrial nucleoid factor 1 n=1 Tax=Sphenodon punctatus TaxID=8508 RepID=A0A8D0H4A7_SPHPU
MAVTSYRQFLKLSEERTVDETKRGRDMETFFRLCVAQTFQEGESTQILDPENCDQMNESLARIHANYNKNKYPCLRDTSFTGVTVEECKMILDCIVLERVESKPGSLVFPLLNFIRVK